MHVADKCLKLPFICSRKMKRCQAFSKLMAQSLRHAWRKEQRVDREIETYQRRHAASPQILRTCLQMRTVANNPSSRILAH